MPKLWKEIAYTSGAKIYSLLLGVVTLVVTAHWLGPQGRGNIAAVTTWVGLFATFGNLSLGQVALHRATRLRDTPWLASTLGSLLFMTALISLAGWIIVLGLCLTGFRSLFSGISPILLALGFLALPFLVWEQYGSSLLMAIDRVSIYNRAQVYGRTVGFILAMSLIVWFHLGVAGVLIAILFSQMTISCAGLRELFQKSETRILPERTALKELLGGGARLHLNSIGSFLFMSTDILLINRFRGATETGHYQMAVQLNGILLMIPTAANMVIFSKMTHLGPDGVWPQQRKILILLTFGMIGIAAVSAIAAPFIIPLVLGKAFLPTVGVFQILLLSLVGMTFSTVMSPQWIGRGMFWQAAAITITVGILNFAANYILVPRYGMYGSVFATLGTYTISIISNLAMAIWVNRKVSSLNAASVAQGI